MEQLQQNLIDAIKNDDLESFYKVMRSFYKKEDDAVGNGWKLLEPKAYVDFTDSKARTPLMWAVDRQNIKMIDTLLRHTIDINQKDYTGRTASMLAAYGGNKEVREHLKKDIERRCAEKPQSGQSRSLLL